ncbi:hypothetical protein [Candidatus Binatus sp.]|uniref:hypothetical protein n=1 Tax=Candidatus Binatus sp. TaxID=2811406 RepID=UPI003F9BA866
MADSPLRECWEKLNRGREHLKTLETEIDGFLRNEACVTNPKFDARQSKYLFRVDSLEPIPQARWALIIGDCVHNARTVLDYIAWRLAGSDLADRDTSFPICLTQHQWFSGYWRVERIRHWAAIAEIHKLQPYLRPNPQTRALWFLQELDARDKHKLLTTTEVLTDQCTVWGHGPGGRPFPTRIFDGPLELDAIIAEVSVPVGIPYEEVKVEANFSFDVTFDRNIASSAAIYSVRSGLAEIIYTVDRVLRHFAELIDKNPTWLSP